MALKMKYQELFSARFQMRFEPDLQDTRLSQVAQVDRLGTECILGVPASRPPQPNRRLQVGQVFQGIHYLKR